MNDKPVRGMRGMRAIGVMIDDAAHFDRPDDEKQFIADMTMAIEAKNAPEPTKFTRAAFKKAFQAMIERRPSSAWRIALLGPAAEQLSKGNLRMNNDLALLLAELCNEHTSCGWITDWEFIVYDAVVGDSILRFGRTLDPTLTDHQKATLMHRAVETHGWVVYASEREPGFDPNTNTVSIDSFEWEALVKLRAESLPGSFTVPEGRAWLELCKTSAVMGLARFPSQDGRPPSHIVFVTALTPDSVRGWYNTRVQTWLPNLSVARMDHVAYGNGNFMVFDRGPERD